MGATKESAHFPGVVEGRPFVAAFLGAALVFDVHHALGLVLAAEHAALLPWEVEVGHASAVLRIALAVLRRGRINRFPIA